MRDKEGHSLNEPIEQPEFDLVANRIEELWETPVRGNFDAEHLKAIHAYIFQDLPHHQPGVTRGDTQNWVKHRALEESNVRYDIGYASDNVKDRLDAILKKFGGSQSLEGLSVPDAAERLAKLYGDLDYAHGFYEGNSRTLREFTRELAAEAGFKLDWKGKGVTCEQRNDLYVARDIEVLKRAFPNLTHERAMQTDNRQEYEASFKLEALQRCANGKTLDSIIESSLKRERKTSKESPTQGRASEDRSPSGEKALPFASDRHSGHEKSASKSGESQSLPFAKDNGRNDGRGR
ncbi:MAG: Fic family protein [Alphaproteobacteria bacterium]|nr:Fic family protein [Alphaproteobacteria bacterium]